MYAAHTTRDPPISAVSESAMNTCMALAAQAECSRPSLGCSWDGAVSRSRCWLCSPGASAVAMVVAYRMPAMGVGGDMAREMVEVSTSTDEFECLSERETKICKYFTCNNDTLNTELTTVPSGHVSAPTRCLTRGRRLCSSVRSRMLSSLRTTHYVSAAPTRKSPMPGSPAPVPLPPPALSTLSSSVRPACVALCPR